MQPSRLQADALDALMPLHLILSSEGKITQTGRTLNKIFAEQTLLERPFFEVFDVLKPRRIDSASSLAKAHGKRLRLKYRGETEIEFRGVAVPTDHDGDILVNLSLGAKMAILVQQFNLRDQDFSPADSSVELLYMIETQSAVLAESRELTEDLRVAKDTAERLALTDPLTDLPNRRALHAHLDRCLGDRSSTDRSFALLHCDLDHFKQVNDNLGHAAGDAVLVRVAEIFKDILRDADFLARTGGDEFVIVLEGVHEPAQVERIAARMIEAVKVPIPFGNDTCSVGTSIGAIICAPNMQADTSQLLRDSDLALYESKRNGRGKLHFFSQKLRTEYDAIARLSAEIIIALEQGDFQPYFQPQLNLQTGKLCGFEALARWMHPTLGLLPPSRFLYVADQADLLQQIDDTIMKGALKALHDWHAAGLMVPQVALNVTAARLADPGFTDLLNFSCDAQDVLPSSVAIEILESVLLDGAADSVIQQIQRLRSLGYSIELDDFGTGHAAISNLRKFDVDVVKIDRSFIDGIHSDPDLLKIARAMIWLIRGLGIEPLAEGVESQKDIDVLRDLGCARFQGFAIARPMPFKAATSWLHDRPGLFETAEQSKRTANL